jgi:hypothetical protein
MFVDGSENYKFQSLFWWIGRSGRDDCQNYRADGCGFNPCFGGLVGQGAILT